MNVRLICSNGFNAKPTLTQRFFKALQLQDATTFQKTFAIFLVVMTIVNVLCALGLLYGVLQGTPSGNNIPLL